MLLEFYESVGRLLNALAVPDRARFDAARTLVNYILGVAAQNAANTRHLAGSDTDRDAVLATIAAQWTRLDPSRYPFAQEAATRPREHDDRDQFLTGVDIIGDTIVSTARRSTSRLFACPQAHAILAARSCPAQQWRCSPLLADERAVRC